MLRRVTSSTSPSIEPPALTSSWMRSRLHCPSSAAAALPYISVRSALSCLSACSFCSPSWLRMDSRYATFSSVIGPLLSTSCACALYACSASSPCTVITSIWLMPSTSASACRRAISVCRASRLAFLRIAPPTGSSTTSPDMLYMR